jgi:hypothetical protein
MGASVKTTKHLTWIDRASPVANGANNRMTIKGMSVHTYFPDFPFVTMNGFVSLTYSWHDLCQFRQGY